jgi:RES domain-containing protein
LTLYRICRAKFPANDGEGAKQYGGRWNHEGTPVLYCAGAESLCMVETLVHTGDLPVDRVVIAAEIPDPPSVEIIDNADLPADWNAPDAPSSTKDIGTRWAQTKSSLVLSVPSAISPRERNYLLNPAHPDFSKIVFSPPQPFPFDPRLK